MLLKGQMMRSVLGLMMMMMLTLVLSTLRVSPAEAYSLGTRVPNIPPVDQWELACKMLKQNGVNHPRCKVRTDWH
ncbi:hypothetical protein PoB_000249700 [Plakobranchus ocellatus]|uniref:Secreted protein n=1 Tax=Plakobranchus ocellatus TaxID=259542 RepID=A0AAV3XZQ4_9GAST|nr:hypothetical protein PoB_000249700 [Plakobranchus ocellatus]